MKKRQVGIAALIIGQVTTILAKDKALRTRVARTPGILEKVKLVATKRWNTNEQLFNEIAATDREDTATALQGDAKHDIESARERREEQLARDREEQGRALAKSLAGKVPTQKALEETRGKYKTHLVQRREKL
ncbi:MAG: hypothetical protein WCJ81_07990 [bacterium]